MNRKIRPSEWVPKGVAELEPKADEAVRDIVSALVVAGPGAGKSELLAQRASYLLETRLCPAPRSILAISFKRDAAVNLRERVALRCGASLARRFSSFTFDAFAKSLVDRFRMGIPEAFRPTADYAIDFPSFRASALRERVNALADPETGYSMEQLQGEDSEEFFKTYIVGQSLAISLEADAPPEAKAQAVFFKHALHSGQRSAVNFPMLGCLAELMMRTNPPIRDALRATYPFVFLDEFQDTTGVQYRLLHTAFHGSEAVLTGVGDHKQRIMLWAGAFEGVFDVFRREFKARSRDLEMNYRSAPRLVSIQHHLIESLDPGSSMPLAADDGADGEGECRLLVFKNDSREAAFLADEIARWIQNEALNPTDICILVRKLADSFSAKLRAALDQRGVQSRVEDARQNLLAEPVTRVTCAFLRLASQQRDPESWKAVIDELLRSRGLVEDDDAARSLDREVFSMVAKLRVSFAAAANVADVVAIIRSVIDFLGESTFRRLHPQYSQGNFFDEVIEECATTLAEARASHGDWIEALDDFLGNDCIPIMTIAKSKGLEFHTVIVLGLEDYAFHHRKNLLDEDECNFFVAFSRAKKRVIFTFAGQRNGFRQQRNKIARYYELLENAGVDIEIIGG